MNNYQLYRTNLLLGGQMKMDLILNSYQNTLYVSDFHLSPISDNTPYTYNSDEYLINNTHQDNIKAYYTNNKGNFYSEFLNPEFNHNWPIICKQNEVINSYSNIYDMGCKRSKRYNEHGKQFEFFCPLWLEHVNQNITFKIDIKNIESNIILGSNALILNTGQNEYHNKFINYLSKYMNNAGVIDGNDDIINVNFNNSTCSITGLNASTGLFETKEYNTLVDNITNRERPLMEVDNMIMQSFKDNSMICKQLFNFNLCFNMEDIFSANIVKLIYGNNVIVSVSVYVGDEQLELKDFYTDYDYISKHIKSKNVDLEYSQNVLDYLHDNEYIEFINKNKFCQSICHWALADNSNYIFNVYEGYSGVLVSGDSDNLNIELNEHQYQDAPNTYLSKYHSGSNSTGWLNLYEVYIWSDFFKYIKNTDKYKTLGTFINGSTSYLNNLKYSAIPDFGKDGIYIVGLQTNNGILSAILETYNCENIFENMYLLQKDNLIILLSNDINNFTFNTFFNKIKTKKSPSNLVKIKTLMSNKIDPSIIVFNKSLNYTNTTIPLYKTSEIDYIKDDNAYNYVLRYDGKIKPSFTNTPNILYYKDYISGDKLKNSIYSDFKLLNYEPLYPSINYCSIKKINTWSYDECPVINVTEHNNPVSIYGNNYEYKWFNVSKCLILNKKLNFEYIKTKGDNRNLDTIITEKIYEYYKLTNIDIANYIKSLYQIENDWEYLNDTTVDDYIYRVSMNLKIYM